MTSALPPAPVIALLVRMPAGLVAESVVLPGAVGSVIAPDDAGLWIATDPHGVVYWVTRHGAVALHPAEVGEGPLRTALSAAGINAAGAGWVMGYTRSGAGAAWPIAGDGRLIDHPIVFGPTVNMVSSGVAVSDLGVGYLAFSALGGGHGLPGVAGVSPDLHGATALLPLDHLAGGGVGALALMRDGSRWAAVPYSRALYAVTVSP